MNWSIEHFILSYYINYQRGWWLSIIVGYLNTKMAASEIVNGLHLTTKTNAVTQALDLTNKNRRKCTVCGLNHPLWASEVFKKMPATER